MSASPPWGLVDARRVIARTGPGELAIAAIAARQHGLITAAQLLFAGIERGAIRYRQRVGRLHAIHRGVFAVGYAELTPCGRLAAAVLACGPTAVISHRSAAILWKLLPGPDSATVHISTHVHLRDRRGLTIHRRPGPGWDQLRRREELPVTSPAMTILDLAETESLATLELALNEARVKSLVNERAFARLAERTQGRAGWGPLLEIFRDEGAHDFSRSRAERLLWKLIREAGLPLPRRNIRIHGRELDFYWSEARLDVEIDGRAAHGTGLRFETDRDRDAHLSTFGIRVMRVTWRQLKGRPELVIERVASALAVKSGS